MVFFLTSLPTRFVVVDFFLHICGNVLFYSYIFLKNSVLFVFGYSSAQCVFLHMGDIIFVIQH